MTQHSVVPGIERIDHVSILVADWERSLRFYGDFLGMACTLRACLPNGEKIARFSDEVGYEIELISHSGGQAPLCSPIAHLALAVRDVEEAIRAAETGGYVVTRRPTKIDVEGFHATVAFFTGPNGESLELIRTRAVPDGS